MKQGKKTCTCLETINSCFRHFTSKDGQVLTDKEETRKSILKEETVSDNKYTLTNGVKKIKQVIALFLVTSVYNLLFPKHIEGFY